MLSFDSQPEKQPQQPSLMQIDTSKPPPNIAPTATPVSTPAPVSKNAEVSKSSGDTSRSISVASAHLKCMFNR